MLSTVLAVLAAAGLPLGPASLPEIRTTEALALERPPDDPARGPLGFLVRTGRFATRAEADARAAELRAAGLTVRGSVFTAEDGERTTGPWVVHVLAVDRRAYRRVEPVLATGLV